VIDTTFEGERLIVKPVGYLINTAAGLQGEPGVFYQYIMAENGLFLQAKNEHLAARICIADQLVRGLAPIDGHIELRHGRIPLHLLNLALSTFCTKPGIEQYLAITWEADGYHLRIPLQSGTGGSVKYEVLPDTVMDIHSHAGKVSTFFSSTDDKDEQGFMLYAVVGGLLDLCPTVEIRIGVYGYFMPLERGDIFVS
jgi:PRTRC genetic system protein A